MPEGDTIFRAAQTLRRALAGRVVTRFESDYPRLNRIHEDAPMTGRTILDVRSAGKHLLIDFSGGLVLRSHLRMHGRWHVYRSEETWRRRPSLPHVVIGAGGYVAVGIGLHDVAFHPLRSLARDSPVGRLGPDLLADTLDEAEVATRLRLPPDAAIGPALLDQWRLAGIGNVYKSETLFLCRANPFEPVSRFTDDRLRAIVGRARVLMRANVAAPSDGAIVTSRGLRRTTGRLNPAERTWVYRRTGLPCRRCGTRIEMRKSGEPLRSTYFCRSCQQVS
jgi:endonuclease-8